MATTRNFSALLNDYLPPNLLKEELIKRNYLLQKVERNDDWYGGSRIVPFKAAQASSISFGSLTAASSITQSQFVRGEASQKEVWGSLIFDSRDLMEHNGAIPEDTFLKILPDELDEFMLFFKEMISINLLTGTYLAKITSSSTITTGDCVVDKIDRFELGQALSIDDDDTSAVDVFVHAIDVNTSTLTLKTSASATSGSNLSSYTTAQNAKLYLPGAQSASFTNLRGALLSSTNSGDSTIHGQTKTSYKFLQAVNVSGVSVTANNILEKILDGFHEVRQKAKAGNANTVIMSYKHLGSCMKAIEVQKGGQKVSATSTKASLFGWTEIEIVSVKGNLTLVGIQEMPDDLIFYVDWKSMSFDSNRFIQKEKSPEGQEYMRVRNTTGYQYIVDLKLFGDLIVSKPGNNGVMHSINY